MKPETKVIFDKLATLENAKEWQAEQDEFLFCYELLAGENLAGNEAQVELLEAMFEKLLLEHEIA